MYVAQGPSMQTGCLCTVNLSQHLEKLCDGTDVQEWPLQHATSSKIAFSLTKYLSCSLAIVRWAAMGCSLVGLNGKLHHHFRSLLKRKYVTWAHSEMTAAKLGERTFMATYGLQRTLLSGSLDFVLNIKVGCETKEPCNFRSLLEIMLEEKYNISQNFRVASLTDPRKNRICFGASWEAQT